MKAHEDGHLTAETCYDLIMPDKSLLSAVGQIKMTKSQQNRRNTNINRVQVLLYYWAVNATPRLSYPGKETRYPFRGVWMGPRAGLDGWGKSRPHLNSISGRSNQ